MNPQNNHESAATEPIASIKIGTRGSELALWQAHHAASLLKGLYPSLSVEIKKINTTGDKILDSPLSKIGDKGLFTKELDRALLDREADIAVHSLKDIPTQVPGDLILAAILEREDVRDIFIPHPSRKEMKFAKVPRNGTVATGSLRRRSQLLNLRPDLTIAEIRGNLNTRIRKLEESNWDGMILAYAGVARLGWKNMIGEILPVTVMMPAVGQGAIGILARRDDQPVLSLLRSLNHEATSIAALAERVVLRYLEGGCQIPIGAHGLIEGEKLTIYAIVGNLAGTEIIRDSVSGPKDDYEKLGTLLGEQLISKGAGKILDEIRKQNEG